MIAGHRFDRPGGLLLLSLAVTAPAGAQPAPGADCASIDALDRYLTDATPPPGADCSVYLTGQATPGVSCVWGFAYRSPAAVPRFEAIWSALTACRPGAAQGGDQPVNHPDSYDLRQWRADQGVYAVSVKDKGASNRTLVFLRFEPFRTRP